MAATLYQSGDKVVQLMSALQNDDGFDDGAGLYSLQSIPGLGDDPTQLMMAFLGGRNPYTAAARVSGAELQQFYQFYYHKFMAPTPFRAYREFFSDKIFIALAGLLAAKQSFPGSYANGPQAQFTAQPIRPVTWYADSAAAPYENWLDPASAVVKGWNTGFWTPDTTVSGKVNGALNTFNNILYLVFALSDAAASPRLFEYRVTDANGVTYPVQDLPLLDTPGSYVIYDLDNAWWISNNQKWSIDLNFAAAGAIEPKPIGIMYESSLISTIE